MQVSGARAFCIPTVGVQHVRGAVVQLVVLHVAALVFSDSLERAHQQHEDQRQRWAEWPEGRHHRPVHQARLRFGKRNMLQNRADEEQKPGAIGWQHSAWPGVVHESAIAVVGVCATCGCSTTLRLRRQVSDQRLQARVTGVQIQKVLNKNGTWTRK
jgi:hypothetical protein